MNARFALSTLVLAATLAAPSIGFGQESVPTANAPQGAPAQPQPQPAPDNVSGPGKDNQAARKAIMDRMRDCMKSASSREDKKACRDEMRKSREAIHEAKKANTKKPK